MQISIGGELAGMDREMAVSAIEERLSQFPIFEGFSEEELGRIGHFLTERTVPAGGTLFQQGDPPDFFYLLERGIVQEVGRDPSGTDVLRRRVEPGEYFGHRPFLEDTPCRATAEAIEDIQVLALEADAFRTVLGMFPRLQPRLKRVGIVNRLLAIPLFADFSLEQLFHVADLVRTEEHPSGQIIFRQGESPDAFYVIDKGQVVERAAGGVPGRQAWPKYLTAGGFFGRYSLLNSTTRRATAETTSEAQLFRLPADAFHWLRELQPGFELALKRHDVVNYLRGATIASRLSDEQLKHLSGYVGLAHYRPGEILYRQGEVDPTLYMLYEGEAIIRARDEEGRDRPRGYLKAGDAVGEGSLFLREPRDVTLESTTESNWFYLTREDLDQFLAERPELVDTVLPREEVEARWRLRRLPWMEPDELLVHVSRRHWFFLASRLAIPLLLVFLGLVLVTFGATLRIAGFAVLGLAFLWIAWRLIDWINDYYAVTTARVAHQEKMLMVWETRDETPLDKIQNINIDRGFVGNTFGFGTLVIDTAAAVGAARVTFSYLEAPNRVQSLIFEQMSRARAGERVEEHNTIRDKLEERIGIAIRPVVPHPSVPARTATAFAPPVSPGIMARFGEATVGHWFWIERIMDGRIVWRKHWIRLLQRIWLPMSMLLAVVLASVISFVTLGALPAWLDLVLVGVSLLSLVWMWWSWEDWGNDQYIVTNDRIIDVEALPAGFRRRTTETKFDRIQNVSFDIPHPIATILNYGTVVIHTAGVEGRLDFEWVRDPKRVQAEIFRRLSAYEELQRLRQREERWADLPQWFAVYEEMRRA
jgi:CRP-like cAMP-binding protein/membrane protein YdbS with pleckstrin-like domain